MYVRQRDLFSGLDKDFVKEFMQMTDRKTYGAGDYVFHEGDHAGRFYVLISGQVRLVLSTAGQIVFSLNHAGEAFGWSSLLGRNVYSASAQCPVPTRLMRISRVKFNMIIEKDPASGLKLIRRLAEMLGHRLSQSYRMLASRDQAESSMSFGSGQLMEPPLPL